MLVSSFGTQWFGTWFPNGFTTHRYMFELTFLTAGPDSQTLAVALYYSMSAAGIRAQQSVDAMAVIYTSTMLVLLVVALRFVNPTQLVARVKETPEP